VSRSTINLWKLENKEFSDALKIGKEKADDHSYDTVKVFVPANSDKPVVPYQKHVPPDVTACIFWLKNRRPAQWRSLHDHRDMAVTKTDEQLREEILGRLQKLGLFEDAGQLKAVV
jgi:hypothetical protein